MGDSMTNRLSNDNDSSDDRGYTCELECLHSDSFGWALSCCGHDPSEAEDVLQTAYLKVLGGRARYDGRASFKTWLFGVIRHTAFDWRRRAWRRWRRIVPMAGVDEQRMPATEVESDDNVADTLVRLARALAELPMRQREVLHLVFYQDLSLSEAAFVMCISVGSARQHYARGKTRLRKQLKQIHTNNE
jgi:RNA polymerase sigma factor (sigma-70 family)